MGDGSRHNEGLRSSS